MKASLVIPKGVSTRAEFETNVTVISRMFDMTRLNVFIQVGVVLSSIIAISTGPTRNLLHHFNPDQRIEI